MVVAALTQKETPKEKEERQRRREVLQRMLPGKRQEIMREIEGNLGQSLTKTSSAAWNQPATWATKRLMDLDRETGISLMEMRNRKRRAIDEALTRLEAKAPTVFAREMRHRSEAKAIVPCPSRNCACNVSLSRTPRED